MPQAGVMEPREDTRPPRVVIDFGVDGSWEPAPARSRRQRVLVPITSDFAALPASRADGDRAVTPGRAAGERAVPGSREDGERAVPARESRTESRASVALRPERPRVRRAAEPAIMPVAPARRPLRASVSAPAPAHRPPRTSVSAPGRRPLETSVSAPVPERRTVQIRGRGAEGYAWSTATTSRSASAARGARGSSPDRMALWAVLLGLLLVLVAATSAHAAVLLH